MATISGKRTVEIQAPAERCFEIAADIERAPGWQPALDEVEVLARDADGRAANVQAQFDARVRAIRSRLRYEYEPPNRIGWTQERGDVKALRGSWWFETLGDGGTRATYALEVDPGRMLGLLLRGPTEAKVRDYLLGGAAEALKARAEGSQ
jgi:ribosome-associated toxin RatA of RatAB toxin-antitoxin module